jgi:signal transduction histidine kinase
MFGAKARRIRELEAQVQQEREQAHDLIANVSHEIRTPLAAIVATVDNICDGVTSWDKAKGERILDCAQRQNNLITFLLDLSKIESGKVELSRRETNVQQWLLSIVDPLEVLEPHKDLTFAINVVPESLTANFDPERMGQVVTNLLTNAINHAENCTEIEVAALVENNKFVILVFNQGQEIKPEEQEIFARFKTDAVAKNRRTGGTGLGLSIAKWIVDLHSGTIDVVNPADYGYPKGALFRVQISI